MTRTYKKQHKTSTIIYLLALAFIFSALVGAFSTLSAGRGDDTAIYGHVKDKDSGDALRNATITISDHDREQYEIYTDKDGYYYQKVTGDKNYSVEAEAADYEGQRSGTYVESGNEEPVNFELEQKSEKTILKGHTKDKDTGDSIGKVPIRVWLGNYSETTESSSEGYYEFELEEGGEYTVRAEKSGYKDYENEVEVKEGDETTHHIQMEKDGGGEKAKISGTVTEKGSNDTISEVLITITDNRDETYNTTTGKSGHYNQEVDGNKNYTVKAEKKGYRTQHKGVYVKAGDETTVNFELEKDDGDKTKIYGYVKDNETGDSIGDAKVSIEGQNQSYTTYTDRDGHYDQELEQGGNYEVTAEAEGYKTEDVRVYVKEGEDEQQNFALEKEDDEESWIYGEVEDKDSGEPIAEAKINITAHGKEIYIVYTNMNGTYHQEVAGDKNYTVIAEKEGYETEDDHVYVKKGDEERVDFKLNKKEDKKTKIYGHVRDKDSEDPLHAEITIMDKDGNYSYTTETDRDGYYEQDLEQGGDYEVTAEAEDYETESELVRIKEGEEEQQDFKLEKEDDEESWIYGQVEDKDSGEPIAEAEITITNHDKESYTVYTNMNGTYHQEVDGDRNYTVVAEKEGYETEDDHTYVKKGDEEKVDFKLEKKEDKKTILRGETRDKDTDRIIEEVQIKVSKGDFEVTGKSDRNGSYHFELPEGGVYDVRAEKEGYEDFEDETEVEEDEVNNFDIEMEKEEKKLKGVHVIVKHLGKAVKHALVKLIPRCNCTALDGRTNEDGYYEFETHAGEYLLEVQAEGYKDFEDEIVVPEEYQHFNVSVELEKLETGKPDLTITSFSPDPTFAPIMEGMDMPLTAEIINQGDTRAEHIIVNFYDDIGGRSRQALQTLIATKTIEFLEPGTNVTINVEWDTSEQAGENTLWVEVDPDNEIEESNEDNNIEDIVLEVLEQGEYGVELSAQYRVYSLGNSNLTTLTVSIENTGTLDDSYTLSATNLESGWTVDFGKETIALEAGEKHSFTVTVVMGKDVDLGEGETMSFKLMARSTGNTSVFDSLELEVKIPSQDGGLPAFGTPMMISAVGVGALAVFFRRRGN